MSRPATVQFEIVSEEFYPGGIRCACGRGLLEGDLYASRLTGVTGAGLPLSTLCCLPCAGYSIGTDPTDSEDA